MSHQFLFFIVFHVFELRFWVAKTLRNINLKNSRVFEVALYDFHDLLWRFRTSCSQIFYITAVLKHFSKIHRKHYSRNFVLKVVLSQIFCSKYVAFFRKTISKNTTKRLLLEYEHEKHIVICRNYYLSKMSAFCTYLTNNVYSQQSERLKILQPRERLSFSWI